MLNLCRRRMIFLIRCRRIIGWWIAYLPALIYLESKILLEMVSKEKPVSFAEDEFGKKLDVCITDTVLKFSGGLILGSVVSLLFFKRKSWPLLMGAGFGTGVAYRTCIVFDIDKQQKYAHEIIANGATLQT